MTEPYLLESLHHLFDRLDIPEVDRHFYLSEIGEMLNDTRDRWQWIAAATCAAGLIVGFVVGVFTALAL